MTASAPRRFWTVFGAPSLRPGRLDVHTALVGVSFVSYIAWRLYDGPAATAFGMVGVGACGWAWLLTRALFDPAPRDAWWARIVGAVIAVLGAASVVLPGDGLAARIADYGYGLGGSAALLLTFVEPFHRFGPGLSGAEKRFRFVFVGVYGLLVAMPVLGIPASGAGAGAADRVLIGCALAGLAGAAAAVWFRRRHPLVTATASRVRAPTAEDVRLAERLNALLREQDLYLDPDLRIGAVAARLGEPEYKVSQCITAAMGFANFNRLINHHRIAHAKALLADMHEERSILEIAFDCGFGSLGPFNRAFKDEAGVTPREFRAREVGAGSPAESVDGPIR